VAGKRRLGRPAGLFARGARGREPRRRRAAGGAARRVRDGGLPGCAQRLPGPARRRLPAGVAHERGAGGRTTTASRSPRSAQTKADLVTAISGDRRSTALRGGPGGGDHGGGRGDRLRAGVLHGQLCAPRRTWTRR
jgi:hypothetical protein